jgi:ATP-dependent protease ClpP protease subunit
MTTTTLAYRITNAAAAVATLWIDDVIGFDPLTPAAFRASLSCVTASRLSIVIDSGGGGAMAGASMYSMLMDWRAASPGRRIDAHVRLAASAASLPAMAADEVTITPTGQFFCHEAHIADVAGTAGELRDVAEMVDRMNVIIASTYARKTGRPADFWRGVMAKSTWFSASESLAVGLADKVSESTQESTAARPPMMSPATASIQRSIRSGPIGARLAVLDRVAASLTDADRRAEARTVANAIVADLTGEAIDRAVRRAMLPLLSARRGHRRPMTSAERAVFNPSAPGAIIRV